MDFIVENRSMGLADTKKPATISVAGRASYALSYLTEAIERKRRIRFGLEEKINSS